MSKDKEYFKRLDYIRILSCFFVLLYHLNIMPGGFLAVCTFFVLSGFLSYVSAYNKKNFSIKKYYFNRIKKIYIPLLVIVSLTVIGTTILSSTWLNLKKESISVLLGYNNFWQLGANLDYFTRHVSSPFMHLWYIAILMQLELVFPFLFLGLRKLDDKYNEYSSIIILVTLALLSTMFFIYMSITDNIMVVYYNTLCRCFSYIYGLLWGVVYCKYRKMMSKKLDKISDIMFIVYGILITTMCCFISSKSNIYFLYMILISIFSCRFIRYSMIKKRRSTRKNKVVSLLAGISYEVYLVQYPIIFLFEGIVLNIIFKDIIIVLLTLVISYILHIVLGRSFKNKNINKGCLILVIIIIVSGLLLIIMAKDNTKEMKLLEDKLNQNMKLIKEKKKRSEEERKNSEEELKKVLDNLENEEDKLGEIVHNLEVVGIGDSVMLGTINEFYNQFPNGYFDGKVSRSIYGAEDLLNELKNKGELGDILIFSLATNGDYSVKRNDELMDIVGDREVYWINAVGADDPSFNDNFKEYAKGHSNIHIVEWDVASKDHPEYFYADGIHVRENFAKYYVDCVYDTIYKNYVKEYKNKSEELVKKHKDEQKNKIAFYGNDILANSYEVIQNNFDNSMFYTDSDYDYKKIYKELEERIKDDSLEKRVVLLFDNKAKLNKSDYQKIVDLGKDYEIYIVLVNEDKLKIKGDNVEVISLYNKLKKDKNNYLADGKNLSKKGNKILIDELKKIIK